MNIQKIAKQVQTMQAGMAQMQARLVQQMFTAGAGGGKVKATANGAGELVALSIDPAVVDPQDVDFLQTLVLRAVQDALKLAKDTAEGEMRKMTGGFGFPMR